LKNSKKTVYIQKEDAHGRRFQSVMLHLFQQAYTLKYIDEYPKSYKHAEMILRKKFQDTSLLIQTKSSNKN